MGRARFLLAALAGASAVVACSGDFARPPPDPCVDSLSIECVGAVGAPTHIDGGKVTAPAPPPEVAGDPDVDACAAADALTTEIADVGAILAGPLAVTGDHIVSLAVEGITSTPKAGGASTLLYRTATPGTSFGEHPFMIAASGTGYLFARKAGAAAVSAIVEITLPLGPAIEVATIDGEDPLATFLGQSGDELFFSTHLGSSGAVGEGDLQVRAFDTQTKQLRKVVALPATFEQDARFLGERNADYWFGSHKEMVVADPVAKTTETVTPFVLGYAPSKYLATPSGLYTYDLDGNWVILDDQLYVATDVNTHPSNRTTHDWDLPLVLSGGAIFATQRMNAVDDDLLKLKRVPRSGASPEVIVCGLSERRVAFDDTNVYFAREHRVLARHPIR